jgi:AcrR family transcriptional regulator
MSFVDTSPRSPDSGRQWRRRARTRARLLAAARDLVAERGLDGVAMSDVTTAADLAAGTIYNYYPSWESLVTDLVHHEIDVFGDALDALANQIADPVEVFAASLRHLVRHSVGDPLWGRFYVQLGVAHPAVLKVLGPRCRRDLQRAIDERRIDIDDLDIVVASTFGALASVLDLVVTGGGPPDPAGPYAAAMLRMVGLSPSEAQKIASRPLPNLEQASPAV